MYLNSTPPTIVQVNAADDDRLCAHNLTLIPRLARKSIATNPQKSSAERENLTEHPEGNDLLN